MPYIKKVHMNLEQSSPYPYNVPAIKFAKDIWLDNPISFFIGDNGTGKSTLIESIAYRLQLPHMDGAEYPMRSYEGAWALSKYIQLTFAIDRPIGFFFRAEDFGDYLNSVQRQDVNLHNQLSYLEGEVPDDILQSMKDNANAQLHHVRENFGQDLRTFSHGEAYLHIIQQKIRSRGIYILDEPEAALSPARQLSLIYYILDHLKNFNSQFIIATHSPILMSIPNSTLYEITQDDMQKKDVAETEHYMITKGFLNHPEMYLEHLS